MHVACSSWNRFSSSDFSKSSSLISQPSGSIWTIFGPGWRRDDKFVRGAVDHDGDDPRLSGVLGDLERRRQAEERRLVVDGLGLLDSHAHGLVGVFIMPANLELGVAGLVDPLVEKPLQVLAGRLFHRLAEIVGFDDLELVRGHIARGYPATRPRRPAARGACASTHAPLE